MVVPRMRAVFVSFLVGVGIVSISATASAFQGNFSKKSQTKSPAEASSVSTEQSRQADRKKIAEMERERAARRRHIIAELIELDPKLAATIAEAEKVQKTKDVLEQLDGPISMDFGNETPLEDILKYIQSATSTESSTGIPIYADPNGLQEAGKTLQSPIMIGLEGIPLRTTLRLVLSQLGLVYYVSNGFIRIGSPPRSSRICDHRGRAAPQNKAGDEETQGTDLDGFRKSTIAR